MEQEPLVELSFALIDAFDDLPLETSTAVEASSSNSTNRETESSEVSWLTDELLELVLG